MAGENKTISTHQEKIAVNQTPTTATHYRYSHSFFYYSSEKQRAEESELRASKTGFYTKITSKHNLKTRYEPEQPSLTPLHLNISSATTYLCSSSEQPNTPIQL